MKTETILKMNRCFLWFGIIAIVTMIPLNLIFPPKSPDLTTLGLILMSTGVVMIWRECTKLKAKLQCSHLLGDEEK